MNTSNDIREMVSTVITVYNKGPYLAEAIESALQQDYVPQEIIVVDDGSKDDSVAVAQSFGDRIRLIQQENRGASGAKNRGIVESRGEFVAFLDGDDRWRPGKLTKQVPLLRRNPKVGVVYSDSIRFSDHMPPAPEGPGSMGVHRFRRGMVLDEIMVEDFVSFSTAVARRQCLLNIGMFNEEQRVSDDYDLWLRMAKSYEFDFIAETLVEYREGTGGLSESSAERLLQHVLGIQERFVANEFAGRYPNRRVLQRATANKYAGHADRLLGNDRQWRAIQCYAKAIQADPLSVSRFYSLLRALVPNSLVHGIKTSIGATRKDVSA